MTQTIEMGRREFLIKSARATGALASAPQPSRPAAPTPGSGPQPDETVVTRIARSELGQGTFTGLAQLVAEELECDWSKVRPEYADVNEHVRCNRTFKDM